VKDNINFFKKPKKEDKGFLKRPKKQNITEQVTEKSVPEFEQKQHSIKHLHKQQQWKEQRRECLVHQFHQQWCFYFWVLLFFSFYQWHQLQKLQLVVKWVGPQISITLFGLRISISTMVIGFVSSFSL
jgi:hypothetical protein